MKFQVTMKDPDGPYECIQDSAKASIAEIEGLSPDERESLEEKRAEALTRVAGKWLKYGEYVTVEFDTEAGTATVVPAK